MNRFRVNLHPALFLNEGIIGEGSDWDKERGNRKTPLDEREKNGGILKDVVETGAKDPYAEVAEGEGLGKETELKIGESIKEVANLKDNIELNQAMKTKKGIDKKLEALAGLEGEKLTKAMEKLMKQLAKNKGIDLPWTNNEWKCSSAEKKLGISSVKVFLQLLPIRSNNGENKVREIFNRCRLQNGPLDELTAQRWGKELGINSKIKDIQNFYKAYTEYQSTQSEFIHVQGLMDFFYKGGIDSIQTLILELNAETSQKISKSDVRRARNDLYEKERSDAEGRYIYTNKETGERVDDKSERTLYTKYNIVKERLKEENDPTERMLKLLCDFNFDGEVNTGDAGHRTGGQFAEVFIRERAISKASGGNGSETITNLIAYAKKMGINLDSTVKDEVSLFNWMTNDKEGYNNTKSIQGLIKNCPADFVDVLDNGENAGQETLRSLMRYEEDRENLENGKLESAINDTTKKIIEANKEKLEKMYSKEDAANAMQQLLSQLPTALLEQAKQVQRGMAVGTSVSLDQIVRGMSAGLHLGVNDEGEPALGLFVGWNKNIDLGKGADLAIGANVGVNAGEKLHFIPCGVVSAEIGKDVKRGKRNKTLDAVGVGRISLSGNAIVMPGGWFLGGGLGIKYKNDKLKGIEDQAVNIRNVVQNNASHWINEIAKGNSLSQILRDQYPDTSDKMLADATQNLQVIFDTLKLEDYLKGKDKNNPAVKEDIDRYAKVVADVFAEQWETNRKIGIADNVRRVSGGGIGIEFFAGAFPVVTAALKFSKYNNLRVVADPQSEYRMMEAETTGLYNKKMENLDSKDREKRVTSLNEILQGFGINSNLLEYIPPKTENKKVPGRIKVPRALAERINVRVCLRMKGYVNEGEDGNYTFPANADFRILTEGRGNQKKAILNIGGPRDFESDVNILDKNGMASLVTEEERYITKGKEFPEGVDFTPVEGLEFTPQNDILKLFDDPEVKNIIKTIDSYGGQASWRKFSEFVAYKTTERKSNEEVMKMAQDLANIMESHPQKDRLKNIIAKLKENPFEGVTDPSMLQNPEFLFKVQKLMQEKLLILDRTLSISANADVTNFDRLSYLEGQRGTKFIDRRLIGPNGKAIFNLMDKKAVEYRKNLINEHKNVQENYQSQIVDGLIGATAFYHTNNSAKGLALTGLGVTSVLNGKTEPLTGEEEKLAKAWFLGGTYNGMEMTGVLTDKSTAELGIVQTGMIDYIKKAVGGKDFKIIDGNSERGLSLNDVKSLLRGETVDISLDNSGKKDMIRLKLDVNYVFYLMGECANESVGLKINGIQTLNAVDSYYSGDVYRANVTTSNIASLNQQNATLGAAAGGGNKGKPGAEEPDGQVGSENYNNGINHPGGSTTIPGETPGNNGQGSDNYNNGINNPSSPTGTPPLSSDW